MTATDWDPLFYLPQIQRGELRAPLDSRQAHESMVSLRVRQRDPQRSARSESVSSDVER